MRRLRRSTAAAVVRILLGASGAYTMAPSVQAEVWSQLRDGMPTVNLSLDDRHIIKEFVLNDPEVPKIEENFDQTIGSALPPSIPLRPFPPEVRAKVPHVRAHEFFVQNEKIFIVDSARKIADVID